ncbi:hypothetical protein ACFQU7_26110 [Pseudoroseomonas wenyumeiae]
MANHRARRWLLWLGIPVLAIGLFLLLFRWDWLIPIVEPRASAALGREVTLEHLHVKLGRTVVVTANNVVVGNPEGFTDPTPFARVEKLSAAINVWDWWRGRGLVLPWVEAEKPILNVRAMPDGRANYLFDTGSSDKPADPNAPAAQEPQIGALRIHDGQGKVVLPQLRADFDLRIATEEREPGRNNRRRPSPSLPPPWSLPRTACRCQPRPRRRQRMPRCRTCCPSSWPSLPASLSVPRVPMPTSPSRRGWSAAACSRCGRRRSPGRCS